MTSEAKKRAMKRYYYKNREELLLKKKMTSKKHPCKTCNTPTSEDLGEFIEIRPECAIFICDKCFKAIIGDTEE